MERYEKSLERFGNIKALYLESESRNNDLSRRVDKLTTSNKKLTTQLAKAKEKLSRLDDDKTCYLVEIIARVRQLSPAMSARLDKIIDEVNPLLKNDI
ncbi:MAG: hypothetical protein IJ882_06880 [Paludibacteraceae bacterium]|nr:hypothetical protein [Paludibacteraceae bacterium]